jgi:hypothetical protein
MMTRRPVEAFADDEGDQQRRDDDRSGRGQRSPDCATVVDSGSPVGVPIKRRFDL